jgi:hypothetical protein
MRYLKHKTVDLPWDHDYDRSPLTLFGGYSDEWESLLDYVQRVAKAKNIRLSIRFPRGFNREVVIRKVG